MQNKEFTKFYVIKILFSYHIAMFQVSNDEHRAILVFL